MTLITLERECEDAFYGFFIDCIFTSKEKAEQFLEKITEGKDYLKKTYRFGEIEIDPEI